MILTFLAISVAILIAGILLLRLTKHRNTGTVTTAFGIVLTYVILIIALVKYL